MSGNVRCVPRFASTNGRQQGNGRYHLERSAANLASSSSLSRSRPSSECRGSKPSIYAPIDPCRRAISIKRLAFSTHARNLRSLREPTVSPRWRGYEAIVELRNHGRIGHGGLPCSTQSRVGTLVHTSPSWLTTRTVSRFVFSPRTVPPPAAPAHPGTADAAFRPTSAGGCGGIRLPPVRGGCSTDCRPRRSASTPGCRGGRRAAA